MLPSVMMGSMLGVLANQAFPSLILQTSLTLLLFILTYQASIKAKQIYIKENVQLAKKREAAAKAQESLQKPNFTQFKEPL